MKNEFLIAIGQLAAEKNLPKEVVFEAVEAALASAYRKDNFVANQNVAVRIHPNTGEVKVYAQKTVVEEIEDPRTQISLEEALRFKADVQLGEELVVESTPRNAGRIAAQTAKQVVLQRLREAERERVFEEFADRESDVVGGVIQRLEPKQAIIDLGRVEAVLPAPEQVPGEHLRVGQRLKVYLLEVNRTTKGPQVVVSRTHKNLLRRLFELEVPEIFNGLVEIKSIAREPGSRSKVAVMARQEGIDAVGSCVGLRGIRIQNIVNELGGERVDVVEWHPDPSVFVAKALSPAQVTGVVVDEVENTARVVVPDRQLSLAIGREGQNARLAAKLTGLRIDIKSQSAAEEERRSLLSQQAQAPAHEEEASPSVEVVDAVGVAGPESELAQAEVAPAPSEGEAMAVAPRDGIEAPETETEAPPEESPLAVTEPDRAGPEEATPQPARVRFAEEVLMPPQPSSTGRTKKAKGKKGALRGEGPEEGRPKGKRPPRKPVDWTEEEELLDEEPLL